MSTVSLITQLKNYNITKVLEACHTVTRHAFVFPLPHSTDVGTIMSIVLIIFLLKNSIAYT